MTCGAEWLLSTTELVLPQEAEDADRLWYQSHSKSSALRVAQAVVRLPEASADTQFAPKG